MTTPLTSTAKAGRVIRLLGWIQLVLVVLIGAAILLPSVVKGEAITVGIWAGLAAAVLASLALLAIGAGIKKNKQWAKVLGVIVSVLSLFNIPIGTLIGAAALFYLARGWREA